MESACEAELSSDFRAFFSVQFDSVWDGCVWLREESTVFEVDFSDSANVVSGNVLVLDDDFQHGIAPSISWNLNVN